MPADYATPRDERPDKYAGTTLTAFAADHFPLLALLCLFLALTVLSAGGASWFTQSVSLFSYFATLLIWIALLYQCLRARPLTPLMELFGLILCSGFVAVSLFFLTHHRGLRPVALPALLYGLLFLLYTEIFPARRATSRRAEISTGLLVRASCLLLAAALCYLLLKLFDHFTSFFGR